MQLFLVLLSTVYSISFSTEVYSANTKNPAETCISVFASPHSIITGNASAGEAYHVITKARVIDDKGNQYWYSNDLSTETSFSFKSLDVASDYRFCFTSMIEKGYSSESKITREISLNAETAMDLFDEDKAKMSKIKPLEREFIRLENVMGVFSKDMDARMKDESYLRDLNETIFDRIKYFSILVILTLVGVGIWQMWYMKRFFKSKKLI